MDLVALRRQWTEDLRADYGSEWVEEHAVMLDTQWCYLVEQHLLD